MCSIALESVSSALAAEARAKEIADRVRKNPAIFADVAKKESQDPGSAVQGGVTAVFEMPNTDPLTIDVDSLADKVRRARGRMHCDFAFFVGGTRDNVAHLAELERLPGAAGIKVFMGSSTGKLLVADDAGLRAILKAIRRRASFHAEDEPRLEGRKQ